MERYQARLSRATFAAIAEHDAKFLEVLVRQVSKDGEINAVLRKSVSVLGHAERGQPIRDRGQDLQPSGRLSWFAKIGNGSGEISVVEQL